jgi:AcrR family transcriptional regulator
MTSPSAVDGRSARAQRTRESVVDAVLELAAAGNARPTAREIADRAGISVRSVYVHFDDLDDLFREAVARHGAQMAAVLTPVDASLPLPERIAAAVDQRVMIHERFGAVRRAAQQWAPKSPALADVLRQGRELGRTDVDRLFGPALAGREDHDLGIAAVGAVLSSETWDQLRDQGLSADAAREVLVHAVGRLLEPPSHG